MTEPRMCDPADIVAAIVDADSLRIKWHNDRALGLMPPEHQQTGIVGRLLTEVDPIFRALHLDVSMAEVRASGKPFRFEAKVGRPDTGASVVALVYKVSDDELLLLLQPRA